MIKFLFIALTAAAAVGNVSALSEEDRQVVRTAIQPLLKSCAKEAGISLYEIKQAQQSNNLQNLDPCFLACIYRETGVLTDDGKVEVEQARTNDNKYITSSGVDFSKIAIIIKKCESVNYAPVSDGSAGCERSKLLANCLFQSKRSF